MLSKLTVILLLLTLYRLSTIFLFIIVALVVNVKHISLHAPLSITLPISFQFSASKGSPPITFNVPTRLLDMNSLTIQATSDGLPFFSARCPHFPGNDFLSGKLFVIFSIKLLTVGLQKGQAKLHVLPTTTSNI